MRCAMGLLLVLVSGVLSAAELKIAGDQMIISGRASGNELALVRDALTEHGPRPR